MSDQTKISNDGDNGVKENLFLNGIFPVIGLNFTQLESISASNTTVLVRGESGAGKGMVADYIHYNSNRREKPYVRVNCAALPESIVDSELFGHERGAFPGATIMRKGRIEVADGGTVYLNEVANLPSSVQLKLLRLLQEGEFERMGSTVPIKTDIRLICSTNRNLEEQLKNGRFNEELYRLINIIPVYMPPLRERQEDIPALIDFFIDKFNRNNHKKIKRITSSAIDMMMVYHWPGNIRELENCVDLACILSTDDVIRSNNLPPTLQTANSTESKSFGTLEFNLEKLEKQMLIDTLVSTNGNMAKAAEILGITERIMGLRIKRYKLDPKRYKVSSSDNNHAYKLIGVKKGDQENRKKSYSLGPIQ